MWANRSHCLLLMGIALALSGAVSQAGVVGRPVRPGARTTETVRRSADAVGQYEKLELTAALHSAYANPFDPNQIAVEGRFITPSGRTLVVPGFSYQEHDRARELDGREKLTPVGRAVFKVRFAWGETGRYTYSVSARDRTGPRTVGQGGFSVTATADPGYVRRSDSTPHYFQFDTGASYFALGENVCWPSDPGTYAYDVWLNKLADAGGNYTRLWLDPHWNELGLEKRSQEPGDGNGLGRYDQKAAWRLDYVLNLARSRGVRVMLCLLSFNSVDATGEYAGWRDSPYNRTNGGPCATPMEFFTNPVAKRLFKQRLRYLVARWGWSPAVLSWEFWNEVDLATGYDSAKVAAWHTEMAGYLRAIDPWQHLLTTSLANTDGDPALDGLSQMDYVQSHSYGSHDVAATIAEVTARKLAAYDKPHYFGEFGIDVYPNSYVYDPDGIHLHNGLWSSMLAGSAGTAMTWWWDNYVEPRNLYPLFAHAAAFAADVDWVRENYQPLQPSSVQLAPGGVARSPALPVVVQNSGADRRRTSHRLTLPNLRVLALANATSALLWVQNRESTWWTKRMGGTPTPVPASVITLSGFTPGEYELQQWDTHAGTVASISTLTCADGSLAITTPAELVTDVAYKVRRRD